MMKLIKFFLKSILKKFKLKIILEEDYLNINMQTLKKSFYKSSFPENPICVENLLSHFSKNYKSSNGQLMQDLVVDYILNKDNGFFVEVGACDGLVHSNTFWLEKNRNWNGILCEPAEFWHEKLLVNRPNCIIEKNPIFNDTQNFVNFSVEKGGRSYIENNNAQIRDGVLSLKSISLNQLFKNHSVDKIDYLSVDTEGSEFDILNGLDFIKFKPSVITIEHNYDKIKRDKILNLLTKNNYRRIFKSVSRFDDWYVDNSFF